MNKTIQSISSRAAGALALCLLAAGCGLDGAPRDDRASTSDAYDIRWLPAYPAIAGVGAIYDIYRVTPDEGPLAGGNPVRLDGVFPDPVDMGGVAAVAQMYTVYFGYNVAPYDYSAPPTISNAIINVIAPPGDAIGLVDVILRETETLLDAATLYYGYEYLDPFDIIAVDPDLGPLAGGQQVTVIGRFPIAAPISTIAAAYGAYQVYFDGRPAGFDATFNPIITSEAMYVITPPGVPPNAPGLVDVSVRSHETPPKIRVLPLGYEYIGDLELTDVDPPRGFIFGDEPVTLEGTFPVTTAFSNALLANQASLYYTAYFGYRIAPFDQTVPTPVITPTEMLVRSPPADAVGFVDVRVEDAEDPRIASTLARAFRYYALYITDIVPNTGSCGGGDQVRIEGLIPAFDAIRSVAEADMYYTVLFDGNVAPFADMGGAPIILPSQIDTINRTYTIGYMYVITPPGAAAGFADVVIFDDLGIDLPAFAPDGFEYNCGNEISRWDTTEIFPNPVGKLEARELLVRITGQGTISNLGSDPIFIVPQGGAPDQPNDRIQLEELSYVESGSTFTWEGTNAEAIPRILNGLLVDGHAAVYIEAASGGFLGDDPNDLTDGGIIQPAAREGRHFLIDTIPPRLRLNPNTGHLRGDDFVSPMLPDDWTVNDVDSGAYPAPQINPHPYNAAGLLGMANGAYDAPFDGNWMYRIADANSFAQVFFNVSSFTNNFADSDLDADGEPETNLQFSLNVVFEDVDIYTVMAMTQAEIDAGRNADLFGGNRFRQVAGFTDGPIASPFGDQRDSALTSGNDVLIQWDFQSTPFRLPEFLGVTASYSSGGLFSDAGNAALSPNLAPSPTLLFGTFNIGDATDPLTGVQLSNVGARALMSVVFRAVDRAGDYTPRELQTPTTPGTKKLYTRNDFDTAEGYDVTAQPEIGPLNLWWLRTTATRLTSNIPASGDTRAPSFSWENTGEPDPRAIPDSIDGDGSQRLYSYAIYRSRELGAAGPYPTRDEQRDGPYGALVGSLPDVNGGGVGVWSSWLPRTTLTALEVQQILQNFQLQNPIEAVEGVWFLLAVMSCDEAGNIELWPEAQLVDPSGVSPAGGAPNRIESVNESGGTEERNWDRWFVSPSGEAVDTRVEPLYWHNRATNGDGDSTLFDGDNIVDPNTEASFGDAEVIPYPPVATFNPLSSVLDERVTGQFRMTLLTDQANAAVEYELVENGVSVGIVAIPSSLVLGNTYTTVIVDATDLASFLGSASRQPTYYTFRARTFIDANANDLLDSGEIYDASPATVQFVVVDNVANFIQNRKSEDTQPIQEMDRP